MSNLVTRISLETQSWREGVNQDCAGKKVMAAHVVASQFARLRRSYLRTNGNGSGNGCNEPIDTWAPSL